MYNDKKKITIIIMLVVICLMVVGYAAFSTSLNIIGTGNINGVWDIYFSNITTKEISGKGSNNTGSPSVSDLTATMNVNLKEPGDYIIFEITITNGGTIDALVNNIDATATGTSAIIYLIEGIKIGDELPKETSKTFTVKIEYDKNVTSQPVDTTKVLTVNISTVQDTGQTITEQIPNINQPVLLSSAILRDNNEQSDEAIDFSTISSDTNGKGLYYTSTNTENNKTTYYFRGDVDNNYVKFIDIKKNACRYNNTDVYFYDTTEDITVYEPTEEQCLSTNICDYGDNWYEVGTTQAECTEWDGTYLSARATYEENIDVLWRIVRINEDGSIRLVTDNHVGYSMFNNSEDDRVNNNTYVGYMYGAPVFIDLGTFEQKEYKVMPLISSNSSSVTKMNSSNYNLTHANTNDSIVKDYLDTWYQTNLSSYSSYLADAGFCNDRTIATSPNTWEDDDDALGYSNYITYYGAYNRLENLNQPQFACPRSHDLFTTVTNGKGNKELDYPIGLLSVDEVTYAGGVYGLDNPNYYLSNMDGFLTMSPSYLYRDEYDSYASVFTVHSNGYIGSDKAYNMLPVRPVINLRADIGITSSSQNGTKSNPYIISNQAPSTIPSAWTLGVDSHNKGEAKVIEYEEELHVKPVITISKEYVESVITSDDIENPETSDMVTTLLAFVVVTTTITYISYRRVKKS